MPSHNQFPWVQVDVWVSELDTIIKHQKLEQFLALEAVKRVVWGLKWSNMFLDQVLRHPKIWSPEWFP